MNVNLILAIAMGGACGAVLRHFFNNVVGTILGTDFPYGILLANVLGSFIMGIFISSFGLFWDVSQLTKAFLTVGMLGAFTTFSTFSLDAVLLYERGEYVMSAIYVISSVILSITALFLAMFLVRTLYSA